MKPWRKLWMLLKEAHVIEKGKYVMGHIHDTFLSNHIMENWVDCKCSNKGVGHNNNNMDIDYANCNLSIIL
jgi:hypothetical protein